ncbi:MAG: hypothetical protein GY953_02900, partial [bacterium]|nr:hypothetical protein [bacterium]
MRSRIVSLVLLLATGGWSQVPSLPGSYERDYIFPDPEALLLHYDATPPSVYPNPDRGRVVSYTAFDDTGYMLTEFRGRHVAYLLPDFWIGQLTVEQRRIMLDRTDLIYQHYTELIGEEP